MFSACPSSAAIGDRDAAGRLMVGFFKPWPTGSVTVRNTMGMERVSWRNATTEGVE